MNTRLLAATLLTAACLTAARAEDAKTFKDDKEKANYAMGLNVGSFFKQRNFEYDSAIFEQGMKDALVGKQGMTMQEANDIVTKYTNDRRAMLGVKNKTDGEAFLAANKTKPGVKVFESGL